MAGVSNLKIVGPGESGGSFAIPLPVGGSNHWLAYEVDGEKRPEESKANGYAYADRQGQGQRRQNGRDGNYSNWERHESPSVGEG